MALPAWTPGWDNELAPPASALVPLRDGADGLSCAPCRLPPAMPGRRRWAWPESLSTAPLRHQFRQGWIRYPSLEGHYGMLFLKPHSEEVGSSPQENSAVSSSFWVPLPVLSAFLSPCLLGHTLTTHFYTPRGTWIPAFSPACFRD